MSDKIKEIEKRDKILVNTIETLENKLKDLSAAQISLEQRWCEKYYDKVAELNELQIKLRKN